MKKLFVFIFALFALQSFSQISYDFTKGGGLSAQGTAGQIIYWNAMTGQWDTTSVIIITDGKATINDTLEAGVFSASSITTDTIWDSNDSNFIALADSILTIYFDSLKLGKGTLYIHRDGSATFSQSVDIVSTLATGDNITLDKTAIAADAALTIIAETSSDAQINLRGGAGSANQEKWFIRGSSGNANSMYSIGNSSLGAVFSIHGNTGVLTHSDDLVIEGNTTFNGYLLFNDPGTNANSFITQWQADSGGNIQTSSLQTIFGANPSFRLKAPNNSGTETTVVDFHDENVKTYADIVPNVTSSLNLGHDSLSYDSAYIDDVVITNNLTAGGDLTVTGTQTLFAYMTFDDSAFVLPITQNVFSIITNPANTLFTAGVTNGITVTGDSIQILTAGTYKILFTMSWSGQNNSDNHAHVFVNGLAIENTGLRRDMTTTGIGDASLICAGVFSANDWISIRIEDVNSSNDLTLRSGSVWVEKM